MISLVPRADSWSGRALGRLGKILGLRSETVYSRTMLVVVLAQFIVLGLGVVLVWLAVTSQFLRADEQELLAVSERVREFLRDGDAAGEEHLAALASALTGHRVDLQPSPGADSSAGVRIIRGPSGAARASFSVGAGPGRREVIVTGGAPFYRTGLLAARTFVVGLAVAGGLMLLVMLFVVDRTIVGRIQLLADKVEHEKDSERLPVKLDYPGEDELAMLARSIEELALLVQQAEREYRHVVEDQTESICRFDSEDKITFANKAFEALCANPPSGKRPRLAACLESGVRTSLEQALRGLTRDRVTTHFTHAGPSGRWYRSVLRAGFDSKGNRTGGQWIAGDVTSEVDAQRKVQESRRQLASLSAKLMTLQDEERRRLARELHDSTAQSLAALEINMSALIATDDIAVAKRLAGEASAISRQVCDELRTISYLLHPPLLEEAGLAFAVRWLVDGFTKRNSLPVTVEIQEGFPRLAPELEMALFRIVQESLSNIYRHAGAAKAWVFLACGEAGDVSLEIRDNGKGLPGDFSPTRSSGVGLAGMRERMRELGGTLEIESSDYGVAVKCRMGDAPTIKHDEWPAGF